MTEAAAAPATRRLLSRFLVGHLLLLAIVLLSPSPALPSWVVGFLADAGEEAHLPGGLVVAERVELVANVLVIVPATAVAAWLWPRARWTTWTAYGFVGALGVEAVQALVLPHRSASHVDVVANTLGALLGSVAADLTRRYQRRHANP